ncbi:MAG: Mrp/NBP35 family ATP-binding protein [Desulfovibrionaceae bacterium]|nr:Mrp/NBP35 family ATP-binding protein [Desulfovibrionaceae bacterium]
MSSCSGGTPPRSAFIPTTMTLQKKLIARTLTGIQHKLFVMSGKGGVGKSSVTVNLAAALASHGHSVGILDVDLHGPSVPRLLGLSSRADSDGTGTILPVSGGANLWVVSVESFLPDRDSAVMWRGPMKTQAILQFLSDVKWGALDYLIIDSPPGTGDEHMTVLDVIPEARCLVVTTPQEISLADVRKALDFLARVKARVLGVVENMSGLVCPHCGGQIDLFARGGGEALAQAYHLPCLGAIPLDPAAVVAADRGEPIVRMAEDTAAKRAFLKLAETVREKLES